MSDQLSMGKIEKKVYLAYHRDGIYDVALGLMLAIFGLLFKFDQAALMGIVPALFIPVILQIKKAVTLPRLGYVQFSPERQQKEAQNKSAMAIVFTVTALLGVVCFFMFTADGELQKLLKQAALIPFGTVLAIAIGIAGILYGMYRFTAYAGLIVLSFIAGHLLNSEPAAHFLFPGLIILLIGMTLLMRFIRKYPRSSEEDVYVDPS